MKVIIEGWKEGLEKVSLTKLQRDILLISLKDAKYNVDALLDGNIIELYVDNFHNASDFCQKANLIGAECKIVIEE